MKKILIIFLMSFLIHNISAQIPEQCSEIDSVYVLGMKRGFSRTFKVSREKFQEEFYKLGKFDIIRDREKINEICEILKDLTPISPEEITCDCNKQKIRIDKRGIPRFMEWDTLDVRGLIVLHVQNQQALIWISQATTEIDCQMYHSSDTLQSYFNNYKYKYRIEGNNILGTKIINNQF